MNQDLVEFIANNKELCNEIYSLSPHLKSISNDMAASLFKNQLEMESTFRPKNIDVIVDPPMLSKLSEIVAAQWQHCGETLPYFSVLASEEYRPENLSPDRLISFYASGKNDVDLLINSCEGNGIELNKNAICFELGCGVGRVTAHLANQFKYIYAVDISAGNMKECESKMAVSGITNVKTILLENPLAICEIGKFDIFFSRLVLQHNPPPVQYYLLKSILGNLNQGGVAFFQMITSGHNYAYSAINHLLHFTKLGFEMHALPMKYVFESIYSNGCRVADVFRDLSGGYNVGSYTFLVVRE